MAEFIDLTGSDDENTVPKPHSNHDRSHTSGGGVDEHSRLLRSPPLPPPSPAVKPSNSSIQNTSTHVPLAVASDLTRSRASQDSLRRTTPSLRQLAPRQKPLNDGAGEASQRPSQSFDAGLRRDHPSHANSSHRTQRAPDASIQSPPSTSATGTPSLRHYPLFSITPQKRKPSNEERPPSPRVFRTPPKFDVPRRPSVSKTPQKITSRDITAYLRPQESANSVQISGQNRIESGTDNTIKSEDRTTGHFSDDQLKNTYGPDQAEETRDAFIRKVKEPLTKSCREILDQLEIKKKGLVFELGLLRKLWGEVLQKAERIVSERVEKYALGENDRSGKWTDEDVNAAIGALEPGLKKEMQTLCKEHLKLVESRCTPSWYKPHPPLPSQPEAHLPNTKVQSSSNSSFYAPSVSPLTQSDESSPDNDVQDLSNINVRAASTSLSDAASSSSGYHHPRSSHDGVKNLKGEHGEQSSNKLSIKRDVRPVRARPSRTAGKSASTLISSLYENPFGSIESNSQVDPEPQQNGVLANAALKHNRTTSRFTPLTGKSSVTAEDFRLFPQKKSVSHGNMASLSAALAITSLEAQHEPIREAVVKEHMQEALVEASKTLLSGRAGTSVLKPRHGSVTPISLTESPKNISSAFTMLESNVKDPSQRSTSQVASLLRHREIGSSPCGPIVRPMDVLLTKLTEYPKPWRSWVGASNDVVTVAWAPDSVRFAAGAAAHSNDEDLHYNRPCNLLYGNLQNNALHELPDHSIDRKRPEQILTGPSANPMVYQSCDPKVYMTVTSVKFSPFTNHMYSASEDQTVRIWDLDSRECLSTTQHEAPVTCLDVSPSYQGLFAAGCKTLNKPIHVCRNSESGLAEFGLSLSSSRAELRQDWSLYPECLQWGQSSSTEYLLLGGFLQWGREEIGVREGHLCLWDTTTGQDLKVTPGSRAVHTASWHPSMPYFAAGVTRGLTVTNRLETKTVVRVWDLRTLKRNIMEYECPAEEITDVTFHPMDRNIATAGCTNGTSYVWDFRWPDKPVHALQHSKSIMPREERDTGVMMSIWGKGSSLYYTGSSDGRVLAWDICRHPVDALVQDLGHVGAGISVGSLSPDGTHLLIGDVTGGIHVLSSAPWAPKPEDDDDPACKGCPMTIVRASRDHGIPQTLDTADNNPGTAGIEAARELIASNSVVVHPEFGPGKGPNYSGPYAKSERKVGDTHGPVEGVGHLQKHVYRKQAFSRKGEIREINAKPIRDLNAARREMLDLPSEPKPRQEQDGEPSDPEESDNDMTESDGSSEDGEGWWPRLGEDEITLARARPRSSLPFDQDAPENFLPERRWRQLTHSTPDYS